ncbi:MAG: hypothetical protein M1834_001397 [Cirrosporium novae-zelandiae]|nr:MAG: hypothetical protein M1834_001397 [Cirrosporium novae-zelandiae]
MDFLLCLSHFCEIHGPTSILCTQVSPVSCPTCFPPTPPRSRSVSPHASSDIESQEEWRQRPSRHAGHGNFDEESETSTLRGTMKSPTNTSLQTLDPFDNIPPGPGGHTIQSHPYYIASTHSDFASQHRQYNNRGDIEGETCASCDFSVPTTVSQKLPEGAPGSPKKDGKGKNGSPVLRSRQSVHACGNNHSDLDDFCHDSAQGSFPNQFSPESLGSLSSTNSTCHNHLLTYLTLHGPSNPASYSLLRRSAIRTLSCELLPRGLSSGPLCFGDSMAGYTIAYIFRLSDTKARGRRRSYALLALAGNDERRAVRACPVVWRAFHRIASTIVTAVEKVQDEEKNREEVERQVPHQRTGSRNFTPVSSFLTGRVMDPDGYPLRAGTSIRAKGLPELVGNDLFFAEMHAEFVGLLNELGSMFGGLPISTRNPKKEERQAEETCTKTEDESQETMNNEVGLGSSKQAEQAGKRSASIQIPFRPSCNAVRPLRDASIYDRR